MAKLWAVAVVSSNVENRQNVAGMLARRGVDVMCATNVSQCLEILRKPHLRLILCDPQFADGTYRDILKAAATQTGRVPKVVLMTDLIKPEDYLQAISCGVFDIVTSPCQPTDIEWMVLAAKRAEIFESRRP